MSVRAGEAGDGRGLYVLGIDGGGTKTMAAIVDGGGRLVGWGRGGPSNPHFAPADLVRRSLADAIGGALSRAGLEGAAIGLAVGAFAGGLDLAQAAGEAGIARWLGVYEHEACMASAALAGAGAVVLSGTGAFEWARGPRGEHRTDGLGSILGDEGSAYWIAREALVAIGRAFDGRAPATALSGAVAAAVGAAGPRDLGRWLYRGAGEAPRHEVAALARIVTAQAAAGDRAARAICHEAARRLARGANTCVRRAGLGGEPFAIVLCGGVLTADAVRAPLEALLARRIPAARAVRPRYAPALGAALAGLARLDVAWTPALLATLDRGQRRLEREASRPAAAD